MKAILYSAHGDLDQISHGDYPTPTAGPDECLLKVKAVALNGFDPMILKGIPGLKTPFPMIPGGDIAGEIVDVGANVPGGKFRPGDRVQVVPFQPGIGQMGETLRGGACDYIAVDAKFLLHIPEGVSYEQAASLPIAYGTARRMMMVRGQVKEGEKVLVLGATGGVGTGAVQLAKMAGAYVIACASSADKCEKLKEIGADETIDTSKEDFVAAMHAYKRKLRPHPVMQMMAGRLSEEEIAALAAFFATLEALVRRHVGVPLAWLGEVERDDIANGLRQPLQWNSRDAGAAFMRRINAMARAPRVMRA